MPTRAVSPSVAHADHPMYVDRCFSFGLPDMVPENTDQSSPCSKT
jgi:hypothetical protein